jgi:putative endonuclease
VAFYVYILASRRNGTRWHDGQFDTAYLDAQERSACRFSKRYGVKMLVWYEQHETRLAALERERQLKKWNRSRKLRIIEQFNPAWSDLYESLSV